MRRPVRPSIHAPPRPHRPPRHAPVAHPRRRPRRQLPARARLGLGRLRALLRRAAAGAQDRVLRRPGSRDRRPCTRWPCRGTSTGPTRRRAASRRWASGCSARRPGGGYELWLAGLESAVRGRGHGRAMLNALFATPTGRETRFMRVRRSGQYAHGGRQAAGGARLHRHARDEERDLVRPCGPAHRPRGTESRRALVSATDAASPAPNAPYTTREGRSRQAHLVARLQPARREPVIHEARQRGDQRPAARARRERRRDRAARRTSARRTWPRTRWRRGGSRSRPPCGARWDRRGARPRRRGSSDSSRSWERRRCPPRAAERGQRQRRRDRGDASRDERVGGRPTPGDRSTDPSCDETREPCAQSYGTDRLGRGAIRSSAPSIPVVVFLTGASGFIGSHLAARSRAPDTSSCSPCTGGRAPGPSARRCAWTSRATSIAAAWLPRLAGVDVVINAVGILREEGEQTFDRVHRATPCALFDACVAANVRQVIQISALGADDARAAATTSASAPPTSTSPACRSRR